MQLNKSYYLKMYKYTINFLLFINFIRGCKPRAGTRLSTNQHFRIPIEHGCNQTIGTKKEPKNYTIEHENGSIFAALYHRILFGAPYYCAFKIFL
jgi:hypothetical protein